MKSKLKKRLSTGKILLATGLAIKALFVVLAALNVSFATGSLGALLPTCFIVGGLAVFALERRGATAFVAAACAAFWLLSVSMTTVSLEFSVFSYFASFFIYTAMLLSMKRRKARYVLIALIILFSIFAILHTLSLVTLNPVGITVILAAIHIFMAVALLV